MDAIRGIDSFVKAVDATSIAGGARLLGISPAAASQNIARLEAQLGTRLLTRTTRRLALTDTGALYYERVRALVRDLELANQSVRDHHHEPQGRLCIAATGAFARHVLAPVIPGFSRRYPQVTVELMVTDRNVDHITESVDASIRIGPALEEGLVARPLAKVPSLFCAAPEYLARAGRPTQPEQLRDHDCLAFRFPVDGRFLRWGFVRDGVRFEAPVKARMVSDDIDALTRMAVAGGGITRLGAFVAEPLIASGELQELFKPGVDADFEAEIEPLEFYLRVRHRRELTPKVRAFADCVRHALPERWRV